MRQALFVITVVLLSASCTSRKNPADEFPTDYPSSYQATDTVVVDTVKQRPETVDAPKASTTTGNASYGGHHQSKQLDNMRGFDPASEDDIDDNGMQRYFDANDDEAWD